MYMHFNFGNGFDGHLIKICKISNEWTCVHGLYELIHVHISTFVSESDILGPVDYLSNIEYLVLFKRALFEDYSFKYRTNIFLFLCQYHHFEVNG